MIGYSMIALPALTLGLFMQPLEHEFGWSRSVVSLGLTVVALVTTPLTPIAGALADRYGARWVAVPGLALNGLAVGCIYGLVALGFVLIYKATELVNFAQGDLLMLGAFVCYMFVVWYGVGYWTAFALAVGIVGAFGAVLDATLLRRVIGQPQFAVVMLTIGLGAMFRSFASLTWGSEIYTLPTPFSAKRNMIFSRWKSALFNWRQFRSFVQTSLSG